MLNIVRGFEMMIKNNQEKENLWNAVKSNKKAFKQKKCCAKDVGLGSCSGNIVSAHSVSRGPNLNKISKSGKVINYNISLSIMEKSNGKTFLRLEEIGTKSSSVFYGFCAKHDRILFSCFENESFTGRPDQCLAITCRTASREWYCKDAASHLPEILHEFGKGTPPEHQHWIKSLLDGYSIGNENGRKDIKNTHDRLFQALAKKEYGILQSLIIKFDKLLPYMFAGAWSPYTDIYGRELQDGFADKPLEQVFISSFAGENCSYVCISWLDANDAPGKIIAEQIKNLSLDQQPETILLTVLESMENVFFNPDWIDALNSNQRELLNSLVASRLDMTSCIPFPLINSNAAFDLPNVERIFYSCDQKT